MPRSPQEAIEWGRNQMWHPSQSWYQLCLSFVRQSYGLNGLYASAKDAWYGADHKHRTGDPGQVPRGAPAFMLGGTWGHVVLGLGNGLCLSNDVVERGRIHIVRIARIEQDWGYPLVGWTNDVNEVTVFRREREKPKPVIDLSIQIREAKRGGTGEFPGTRRIQRQLNRRYDAGLRIDGRFGKQTKREYAEFERKIDSPSRDGIPGEASLTYLAGNRYRVRP